MSLIPAKVAGASRGWFLLLLLVLPLLFLFAKTEPPASSTECLKVVKVGHSAHFVHICDSYSITSNMENLEGYFKSPNPWRGRPVYILTATGLAGALSPVATIFKQSVLAGRVSGDFNQSEFLRRFPSYFALGVMNFIVLAAALYLALHLGGRDGGPVALGLAAIVGSSDFMHSLFWSQHPSFLNILVPLGAAFFFTEGVRAGIESKRRMLGLGLFQAVAVLDYAYAAIWAPAFLLGLLYQGWRGKLGEGRAAKAAIVLTVGLGPYLGWFLLNALWLHVSISFEAEAYRQFIWILDAKAEGHLAAAFAAKVAEFVPYMLASQGWAGAFALAALALLLVIGIRKGEDLRRLIADPLLLAGIVALLGMLGFNFLQGYYQPRLMHGLTIALFLLLARAGQLTGQSRSAAALLFAGAALQIGLAFTANPLTLG